MLFVAFLTICHRYRLIVSFYSIKYSTNWTFFESVDGFLAVDFVIALITIGIGHFDYFWT